MQGEIIVLGKEEVRQVATLELFRRPENVPEGFLVDDHYLSGMTGKRLIQRMAFELFNSQGRRAPDRVTDIEISEVEDQYRIRISYR